MALAVSVRAVDAHIDLGQGDVLDSNTMLGIVDWRRRPRLKVLRKMLVERR